MQGAVSGFIWLQNDPKYRDVEFGRNRDYWRSRLRAGAFTWVYSTAVEIGPFSEAFIGKIQAKWPEQGFVDHVITPLFGMGWLAAEDALDRFLIRRLEQRTSSRVVRAIIRGSLNPTRSFANVFAGRYPWRRSGDESQRFLSPSERERAHPSRLPEVRPGVAPLEVAPNLYILNAANGPCVGGGATVAFRLQTRWKMTADVNGCEIAGLENNRSGDYLTYLAGPRWTPTLRGRWHCYFQVLGGGAKISQDLFLPGLAPLGVLNARNSGAAAKDRSRYTRQFDTAGWAAAAGAGLDWKWNEAFAVRLISVDYTRTWTQDLPGFPYPRGFQIKTGMVLRVGTW